MKKSRVIEIIKECINEKLVMEDYYDPPEPADNEISDEQWKEIKIKGVEGCAEDGYNLEDAVGLLGDRDRKEAFDYILKHILMSPKLVGSPINQANISDKETFCYDTIELLKLRNPKLEQTIVDFVFKLIKLGKLDVSEKTQRQWIDSYYEPYEPDPDDDDARYEREKRLKPWP